MPLSKFQKAVQEAAQYYAPTLGLDPSELARAMFTIAGLEGGLGEEAGRGDGGASVGRFQFNTNGGHGATLLQQGHSLQEIMDDEFQAWHWAPILGQALKSRIDQGMDPDKAIIQAGFDVERPAAMYDSGRAAAALQTASSLAGGGGSSPKVTHFGRMGPALADTPAGGTGTALDALMGSASKPSDGGTTAAASGSTPFATFLAGLGLGNSSGGSGHRFSMSDPLGQARTKLQQMTNPDTLVQNNLKDLYDQILQYKLAGKPVPSDLQAKYDDLNTWYASQQTPPDPTTAYDQQMQMLQALQSIYGTAVQAGSMKANAAANMLQAQIEQAPFLTAPHEYKPGFGPGGFMEAAYGQAWKPEDWKTQQVQFDDPHTIMDQANGGLSDAIAAMLGGGMGGGSAETPPRGQVTVNEVPQTQEPRPGGQYGSSAGVSDAVNAFLTGAKSSTPADTGGGGGGGFSLGGLADALGKGNSPEDWLDNLLGGVGLVHAKPPTSINNVLTDVGILSGMGRLGKRYNQAQDILSLFR